MHTGEVILVGAGPGDPGLLTLAGRDALQIADVVLHDRLAGPDIIAMIPEHALRIDVGKNKGSHPVPQEEINRLLLEHARLGKRVVRLKGGDPYLFGRGAEELEALEAARIPFRVIPGVTSALAAPACAGIPVTHRAFASSVHIYTAHGKEGAEPDIDWNAAVRTRGTLVFLMSYSKVREICTNLIHAGMDPSTPASMIENGSTPAQQQVTATLADLPDKAAALQPPALIIVGAVCSLAERFDWMRRLPLHGMRVLAVGSAHTGQSVATLARARGADADAYIALTQEPLPLDDAAWEEFRAADWIALTSRFGAQLLFGALRQRELDLRALAGKKIAAIGAGTAEECTQRGITPDYVPQEYCARALGEGLARLAAPGTRVLLWRARAGSPDLPAALSATGVCHTDLAVYATHQNAPDPHIAQRLVADAYDAVILTSPTAAQALAAACSPAGMRALTVCIGGPTATAAKQLGFTHIHTGENATPEAVLAVLERKRKHQCT